MPDPQDGKPVAADPGISSGLRPGGSRSVAAAATFSSLAPAAPCFSPESGPGSPAHRTQWQILLLSIAALALLALSRATPDRDGLSLVLAPGLSLPETCLTHRWFGIRCPGCGLTRSGSLLLQGHWRESLAMHRCGWIAVLMLFCQIPWRVWWIRVPAERGSRFRQRVDHFSLLAMTLLLFGSRLCDAMLPE